MQKMNITVSIRHEWNEQLGKIARAKSAKENKDINRLDLIREAIQEKYGLKDTEETKD